MKKSDSTHTNSKTHKLSLRAETVRILTERELILVAAGNCVNASMQSQISTANLVGAC
jgi:hypothetical protein